ncbi:MAG: hypothetical protein WAV41_00675 [Microgenomates group bacterium]
MPQKLVLHPSESGKPVPPLKEFQSFIKVSSAKTRQALTDTLEELHTLTSEVWRPGACYAAEHIQAQVEKAKREGRLTGAEISVRSFAGGAHYHLVAEVEGQELVVDPFGVPTPGKDYHIEPRTITPFFGEAESAPEHHRRIYEKSESLGDRGFRRFSP